MSQQEPVFYNLEYFGDAPFWSGVEEFTRCTFLMPLSNPAEFLAFGVFGPSNTVLFVARGRVREHLGDFLSRMEQAGASVELYEVVPLPRSLVKRYTSDDPFDGDEISPPKGSTDTGRIAYGGGAGTALWEGGCVDISVEPTWPAQDISSRKVFIMPLPGGEFLALGVCSAPERNLNLFVFAARGMVSEHLAGFITRMKNAPASVELGDWPKLDYLQQYVTTSFPKAYEQRSALPSTGGAFPVGTSMQEAVSQY